MPGTVNGIGTHYYGRRNESSRQGTCHSCHAVTTLHSYDTRLWFVILFIPIVPLGRKRITDDCSSCRMHFVAPLHQWEMQRQLGISGSLERYREHPTAETALEAHGTMLAFRMFDEAAQFGEEVLRQLPDNAPLLAGLAAQLEAAGEYPNATPLYAKALELRPDLPLARVGMALRKLNESDLDGAAQLLAFLKEPGAGQLHDLNPLMTLAEQYQRAGRHQDCLDICQHVVTEHPQMNDQRDFRQFVHKSEKALKSTESLLAEKPFSLSKVFGSGDGEGSRWPRNLAIAGIVIGLIAGAMALQNEYRRRHRTLHVLNETGVPATLQIDEQPSVQVLGNTTVTLPEGRHHVVVKGPIADEFDIDLQSGYFERWSHSPAWVVNIGGATALQYDEIHYAVTPQPPNSTFYIGERFLSFPHVDYLFVDPPQTIKIEKRAGSVRKTHLGRIAAQPEQLFVFALNQNPEKAFRFAEALLLSPRSNDELVEIFAYLGKMAPDPARVEKVLKEGLGRRPLSIPWHRAYQHAIRGDLEAEGALRAEYDAELTKSPNDAGLLYLRGRIADNREQETVFFERSAKADPKLVWPWYALAYGQASRGNWKKANEYAARVKATGKSVGSWPTLLPLIRLGAGEGAAVARELTPGLSTRQPMECRDDLIQVCDALASVGQADAAKQRLDEWWRRVPPGAQSQPVARATRATCLYILGDYGPSAAEWQTLGSQESSFRPAHARAETDKPREVAGDPQFEQRADAWAALALALSFHLAGDAEGFQAWTAKAADKLDSGTRTEKKLADWLRGANAPAANEIDELNEHPTSKMLALAVLAIRHPTKGGELQAYALRLNVSRQSPYRLIQRTCGEPARP